MNNTKAIEKDSQSQGWACRHDPTGAPTYKHANIHEYTTHTETHENKDQKNYSCHIRSVRATVKEEPWSPHYSGWGRGRFRVLARERERDQEEDALQSSWPGTCRHGRLSPMDACRQIVSPFGRLCGRRWAVIKIF